MEDGSHKLLRRHLLFMLAALGAAWLCWRRPSAGFFWWGVVTGSVLMGVVGCYMFSIEGSFRAHIRFLTQINPIVFGQFSVALFALTSASFTYFYRLKPWTVIFPALGMLLSLVAAIGSETRGAWLAIPVVILIIAWHHRKSLHKHYISISMACILFFILFFAFSGCKIIENRFFSGTQGLGAYLKGEDAPIDPSVRTRLDMWKAAFEAGKSSFIIGPGKDEFREVARAGVERGIYIHQAGQHHFPHSEYATAFGYHGISGLIALCLAFIIPGQVFWKKIKGSVDPEVQCLAVAGLMTVICFAIFSLTDSPFEQRPTIMFYSLMLLLPLTLNPLAKKSKQGELL